MRSASAALGKQQGGCLADPATRAGDRDDYAFDF
jgi:hypothetical protein